MDKVAPWIRQLSILFLLVQGIAIGLFLGSPLVTLYALIGAIGWHFTVRPWEEADLERRFGTPYTRYRDNARCWIPRLHPYEG